MKTKNHSETINNSSFLNTPAARLLNATGDVMCCISAEGKFIYINDACINAWGYQPSELTGKNIAEFIVREDYHTTCQAIEALKKGEAIPVFKTRIINSSGAIITTQWSAQWQADEKLIYCRGKVAKNKKASKAKEIQKKLFRAYKLAQIGWWELDFTNMHLEGSIELFEMYGLQKKEDLFIPIDQFLSMVHPEDVDELKRFFTDVNTIVPSCYEHRFIKPNGETIYLIHYIETVRNKKGEVLQIYGTTKNITPRKTAQLALIASEKKANDHALRLEETLDNFGNSFITLDKDWSVTFWNKRTAIVTGISKEKAIGKNFWQLFPKAKELKFYKYFTHALEHHVHVRFEEYSPTFQLWLEVRAYPTSNGLSVYIKNLNQQKQQEQEIKLSNERFELAAKATSDALWDWDLKTHTCYFNDAFTTIYGHKFLLENGKQVWQEHLHPSDKKRVLQSLIKAVNDPSATIWQQDYKFIKKDGAIAFVHDRGTILRDDKGVALRMVGAMRDLTEKIKLEQLIAEEKVEMQKQISKTIIKTQEKERSLLGKELHDNVNQLLTTAKLYVENVSYYPDQQKQFIDKATSLIQKGINELRYLSKTLITPTLSDIGFEASIQELIDYYKYLNLFDIQLGFGICEEKVDKELRLSIYRILQELLNNTVKYAGAKTVTINFIKDDRYITILYKDDGVGFDKTVKKNGLGLFNIKNRIELFKGKMRLATAPGKGFNIMIVFPYS